MEFPYNYIAVVWLATWLMVIIRLYLPSMKFLGKIKASHAVYRYRHINLVFFSCFTFFFVPLLILPVLSNKHQSLFIRSYLGGILSEKS
jgi:hypothetical protein